MRLRTYAQVVENVLDTGTDRTNKRTGEGVRETFHQYVELHLGGGLPIPGLRRVYPKIAAIELAWSILGRSDVEWMEKRGCKIWSKFATTNGKIEGAYGHRWRTHFGRDQLNGAMTELWVNDSSRQALVVTWDPREDGLVEADIGVAKTNVPCPFAFIIGKTDFKLNLHCFLRSSDVLVGLPYDIMFYGLLLDAVAAQLKTRVGRLALTLTNAHVYTRHLHTAEKMVRRWEEASEMTLPNVRVRDIERDPDDWIATVASLANTVTYPTFKEKLDAVL